MHPAPAQRFGRGMGQRTAAKGVRPCQWTSRRTYLKIPCGGCSQPRPDLSERVADITLDPLRVLCDGRVPCHLEKRNFDESVQPSKATALCQSSVVVCCHLIDDNQVSLKGLSKERWRARSVYKGVRKLIEL